MSTGSRPRRWWEVPLAERRKGEQGWLALVEGRDVGVTCPKCKEFPVVYNGNYFCDNYNSPELHPGADPNGCDWALAHPAKSKRDREICDLIGLDYH